MYLGTTLTDQNYIHEEIKSGLNSGNVCYHSVQNPCLPVCYHKYKHQDKQNSNLACCFVSVRLGLPH
jgi:hypothetical protein